MSSGVPYSVSNLANSYGEFQYPQGREIPSMHTGDLQAARPHQNTRSRNVWADEYVDTQIKHEPQKIQRQTDLNKRYRNPLFNDYHYQKGNQGADLDFTKNVYNHHNQIDPKLKMNDSLDSFMSYQKIHSQYNGNKSTIGGASSNNFIKQATSPYVMKVNPGVQQYKPGPFANISSQLNDESKSILKRPELVPTRKGFNIDQSQSFSNVAPPQEINSNLNNQETQPSRNPPNQNPYDNQNYPNSNNQQQNQNYNNNNYNNNSNNNNQNVQNIINNQRYIQDQVQNENPQNRVNSQRKVNSVRNNQVNSPQLQQFNQNQQQNGDQYRVEGYQAPIKTPNQRYIEDAYRSNQIYSSQDPNLNYQQYQQLQSPQANSYNNYQGLQQRNGSMPNIHANYSQQFQNTSNQNKQYNITNVVTHKDYLKYQPKYDVGIQNIHENLKEKFQVNQFGQFDFKDMAPVDIKKQKNQNIFSSMDGYTTTTRDQQQMYDYWKKMQELKQTQIKQKPR